MRGLPWLSRIIALSVWAAGALKGESRIMVTLYRYWSEHSATAAGQNASDSLCLVSAPVEI